METKPPEKFDRHQWHWLYSERAMSPCMSEWIMGLWYSAGESGSITPKEMHARGWKWLARALPPPIRS